MEHIIVRETSSEMRAIARKALRGNWTNFAIVMAIYYLLMITLPYMMDELIPGATISQLDELTGEMVELPIVSSLYSLLLAGPLSVGLCSVTLHYFRRKDLHAGHLFDGFEYFLKCVGLIFLMGLYIFLWSLLLFIPGIIAVFRYSQAPFILADHPEYSIGECIRLSKEYMSGNKTKYFCYELSFIGWEILASIPASILGLLSLSGIVYNVADFVISIPFFFYLAYNGVGGVVFYELVSGNLMAKPAQVSVDSITPLETAESAIPTMVEAPAIDESPAEGETQSAQSEQPEQYTEANAEKDEFDF